MNVMVVSDTHGRDFNLLRAIELESKEEKIDLLLHLGDLCGLEGMLHTIAGCPVHYVAGNCDGVLQPSEKLIEIDGIKAYMTHGHRLQVGGSLLRMEYTTKEKGAYIGFYGHTHVPRIDYCDSGVVLVNPGSIERPRQSGFRPSYIMMNTNDGGEPIFEIKYL